MARELTTDAMNYMISRLISRADEAVAESNADPQNDFEAGRRTAYYEMLDILRSELQIRDQDLERFGLNFDLERTIA